MSHSNSSLNTFANCMAKYEHSYILKSPQCKPPSPHLTFGAMAHEVLYKAGLLRDASADGVLTQDDYIQVIPSEVLYPELKEYFNILSWTKYFTTVVKECAKFETQLCKTMNGPYQIERELKLSITPEQLESFGIYNIKQSLVGIIDLLIYTNDSAIILDYKFSSSKKSQDDFDMNSQLPLYAFMIHVLYDIPLHNIQYGYIDIPKVQYDTPILLSNGTLSRSKSQNTSQKMYEQAVIAIHGEDDPVYNCKPGGHYYDCWSALALNQPAYLSIQYLDVDAYAGILKDLFDAAKLIDYMIDNKLPFVKKYDSYSCKGCEYLPLCKPWLSVDGGE